MNHDEVAYPDLKIPAKVKAGPRAAYGAVVLERLRALQLRELETYTRRGRASLTETGAESGTTSSDPDVILARIRADQAKQFAEPMPWATRFVGDDKTWGEARKLPQPDSFDKADRLVRKYWRV